MKKFLTILAALMLTIPVVSSKAATDATVITSASTNSLLSGGVVITKITVANGTATDAATVQLFDSASTNYQYVVGAYTNKSLVEITQTNIFTNILNVVQTNTFPAFYYTNSVTAASTNNYRTIISLVVPANESLVYEPVTPLPAFLGVASTNNTNVTITLEYQNLK